MKILCLCPTFGRKAAMLENTIQLFLNQTYKNADLFLYDDLGTLGETVCDAPRVLLLSTNKRANSVGAKYNTMMQFAYGKYDGVVVWDDDDLMRPNYISSHVEVLTSHEWSKPSTIISAYHRPPAEEKADGRFHGSIAARTSTIRLIQLVPIARPHQSTTMPTPRGLPTVDVLWWVLEARVSWEGVLS